MTQGSDPALRNLLQNLFDYAGLFPPAELDLPDAVRNFADYRTGAMAWALGRLVVPIDRLAAFETHAARYLPHGLPGNPWRLSVLASQAPEGDGARIERFNQRHAASGESGAVIVDAWELRFAPDLDLPRVLRQLPPGVRAYVELPLDDELDARIAELGRLGARAKVRTGGTTPAMFPEPAELLRFLRSCVAAGVAFKATAGLHHPLRATHPLTYAPDSPTGRMFGFLNVLLATTLLVAGGSPDDALELLEEIDPAALRFHDRGVTWRTHTLGPEAIEDARRALIGIGSCSFAEPIADLKEMKLL